MQYICDAPDKHTWFRIETEAEAEQESTLMNHAVAKHFRLEREKATRTYRPTSRSIVEQNIGLEPHIQREMPWFLTLRDSDGDAHVTAMLPPGGTEDPSFTPVVVGKDNSDPYPEHGEAIDALAEHLDIALDRARSYPYRR